MKNPFKKFQNSTKGNRVNDGSSNEDRPFSLSGWFNSVKNRNRNIQESSLDSKRGEKLEVFDSSDWKGQNLDEECRIKLALELSAKEDPEAADVEAVKQISFRSLPLENSPAEVVAYQYWIYALLHRITTLLVTTTRYWMVFLTSVVSPPRPNCHPFLTFNRHNHQITAHGRQFLSIELMMLTW